MKAALEGRRCPLEQEMQRLQARLSKTRLGAGGARCTSCLTPLTSVSLSASHSPPSLFSHSLFLLYEQPECIVRTLRTYNLKASCQHARAHMHTHNCMSKMETGSYQPKTSISSTSVPRRIRAGSVASDHGPLSSATLRCTSRVQISR